MTGIPCLAMTKEFLEILKYWYCADMKYLPGSGNHASVVSDAVVSFIAN